MSAALLSAGEHWSLQPVARTAVPENRNPVDYFIQQNLAEAGLKQNPPADRFTLLRRATIDLTGLPPTPEEIEDFASDSSAGAWPRLVDRLLASPHYGERRGRQWLDVARYVQGTIKVPGIDEIDLAAPYRDYVVRSFNADKPFDRFLAEQLAGDLLGTPGETAREHFDRITAPAFLSIGQWFEECTDPNKLRLDIIDEQISTTTRAFLAMDFACSRCHDHKDDPIPTRDYYAMAGIFRSTEITSQFSEEWKDGRPRAVIPLAGATEQQQIARTQQQIQQHIDKRKDLLAGLREDTVSAMAPASTGGRIGGEILAFEAEDFDGHKNLRTTRIGPHEVIETRKAIDRWVKYRVIIPEPGDYTLLVRYAAPVASPVILELELKDEPERILTTPTYGTDPESFLWDPVPLRNLKAGSLHLRLKVNPNEPFPILDSFKITRGILDPADLGWRRETGPPTLAETPFFLTGSRKKPLTALDEQIKNLRNSIADLPLTLGVAEAETPRSLPVHIGGDVYRTDGNPVPRAVPTLADHLINRATFAIPADRSGRVELARWLTHPDHPLTARVIANRIWHWHFGTGIVRTMDDFGRKSSPPTHPELLDWLASELIASGWSLKHLHRIILNSETYRASSQETAENLAADPDGILLSRFPARRLEVEALYDGMISSIGKTARQDTGQTLDPNHSKDRALYILTSARSPMGLGLEIRKMFPLFGFDESGRPMHDRDESLTAAQSLWWLNNPLPRYYAENLAADLLAEHDTDPARAAAAYERIMGMPLTGPTESAILRYIEDLQNNQNLPADEAWTRAALGLYSSHPYSHLE